MSTSGSRKTNNKARGKGKVIPRERKDFKLDKYNNNRPRRDFTKQSGSTTPRVVNTVF